MTEPERPLAPPDQGNGRRAQPTAGQPDRGERAPAPPSNPNLLRDRLANERTFLAWLRTGVAITSLGFVVARFDIFLQELARSTGHPNTAEEVAKQSRATIPIGVVLVVAGALMVLGAMLGFLHTDKALIEGDPETRPGVRFIIIALTVLALAAGGALALHLITNWPT